MMEIYVLHITKKCNMQCLYCYEKDKVSEYSFDEIKNSIENIFNGINEKINIEFLGGEPLLRTDLVIDSVNFINSRYKNLINSFIITTNGTIINDELIDFLKKNKNVNMAISLDGNKFSNQLRTIGDINSYDIVIKNIKKLQENNINISIHMVTHPYNIAWMSDNIKHFYSLGIKHIGIGTIESTIEIDEDYCNTFNKEIEKISHFVIKNPDMYIDLFDAIKPKSDIRTYIKDKNGKVLFENYGRIHNNEVDNDKYDIMKCDEETTSFNMIYNIRSNAYIYHYVHSNNKHEILQSILTKLYRIENILKEK